MICAEVPVQCPTSLRFIAIALLAAWMAVAVLLSAAMVDLGGWSTFVVQGSFAVLLVSVVSLLVVGGRPACGNCGERVLDGGGVPAGNPVVHVKPFASVSMRALFAGSFQCPHCGIRNIVRRS